MGFDAIGLLAFAKVSPGTRSKRFGGALGV